MRTQPPDPSLGQALSPVWPFGASDGPSRPQSSPFTYSACFKSPICSRTFTLPCTLCPALSPSLFGKQGTRFRPRRCSPHPPPQAQVTCLLPLRAVCPQRVLRRRSRGPVLFFRDRTKEERFHYCSVYSLENIWKYRNVQCEKNQP